MLLKYSAFIATFFISSTSYCLNGLRPIGATAYSRSMGGTGVSKYSSSFDAVYKNPALLSRAGLNSGISDMTVGLTAASFESRVKSNQGIDRSDWLKPKGSSVGVFPSGGGAGYRLNSDLAFGFGFVGGGGGSDYGDAAAVLGAESTVVAFSALAGAGYRLSESWSLGMTLWATSVSVDARSDSFSRKGPRNITNGKGRVFGASFGAHVEATPALNIGFYAQPPQNAVVNKARDYWYEEGRVPGRKDDVLFTAAPLELASGLTYSWSDRLATAVDVRFLQWSKAEFLKELGWEDQAVVAVGGSYELIPGHTLRMGYNYGNKPTPDVYSEEGQDTIAFQGHPLKKVAASAIAGIAAFGVTKEHYTLGSSHEVSDRLVFDSSLTYMVPETVTRNGSSYSASAEPSLYGWTGEFQSTFVQLEMRLFF